MSSTDTTDDLSALLDRLEAAAAAATPGPWGTYWGTRIAAGIELRSAGGVSVENYIGEIADEDDRADYDNSPNPASPSADAALIVAAVNALPTLIAELRAYQAAVQAVRELAERYEANGGWDLDYATDLRAAVAALDPKEQG